MYSDNIEDELIFENYISKNRNLTEVMDVKDTYYNGSCYLLYIEAVEHENDWDSDDWTYESKGKIMKFKNSNDLLQNFRSAGISIRPIEPKIDIHEFFKGVQNYDFKEDFFVFSPTSNPGINHAGYICNFNDIRHVLRRYGIADDNYVNQILDAVQKNDIIIYDYYEPDSSNIELDILTHGSQLWYNLDSLYSH